MAPENAHGDGIVLSTQDFDDCRRSTFDLEILHGRIQHILKDCHSTTVSEIRRRILRQYKEQLAFSAGYCNHLIHKFDKNLQRKVLNLR